MFLAFNVLLDLNIEDGVITRDLGVAMKLNTGCTQQLGTVDTLACRISVLASDQLADVAIGKLGWFLTCHYFTQGRH